MMIKKLENFFDIHKLLYTFLAYNIPVLLSFSGGLSSTAVTVDNSDSTDALFSVSSSQVKISFSSSWLDAVNFFDVDVARCRPVSDVEHNTGGELVCGKTGDAGFSLFSPDLFTKTCTGRECSCGVKMKQGYTQHDNLYPLNTKDLILMHMVKCLTKIYYI